MQNGRLSNPLIQFIEQVLQAPEGEQAATVLDLRLVCRRLRLSEESEWSLLQLDQIERDAVQYGDQTKLTKLVSGEATPESIQDDVWLNSPSPFAWT